MESIVCVQDLGVERTDGLVWCQHRTMQHVLA